MLHSPVPVIGFAAWSGTGKTTLLTRLLPILKQKGLRVGLIKHAHHQFEIDIPGKDSYELRKSGASQVLVCSKNRWALLSDRDFPEEPKLQQELQKLQTQDLDIILVEGFKHEHFDKIEIYRQEISKPLIYPEDQDIIAIICNPDISLSNAPQRLDINNLGAIAEFIMHYHNKAKL